MYIYIYMILYKNTLIIMLLSESMYIYMCVCVHTDEKMKCVNIQIIHFVLNVVRMYYVYSIII